MPSRELRGVSHLRVTSLDIIVLGCVRTRNLGFIEDCRRLNVAITRARRHLIIVGKELLLRRS